MIRRLFKWLLILPLALLIVAAAAWLWLWHTASGAQWVWDTVTSQLAESDRPATLDGRIEGTLGGQLRIRQLRYQDADVDVTGDEVTLAVKLGFMPIAVRVSELDVQGVVVRLEDSEAEEDESSLADLGDLDIPYPLSVQNLRIVDGSFVRGDFIQQVNAIEGSLFWHTNLDVEITRFETPELAGSLSLESALSQPFNLAAEVQTSRFTAPESLQKLAPWLQEEMDATASLTGSVNGLEFRGRVRWPDLMPEGSLEGQVLPLDGWSWKVSLAAPQLKVPERWVEETIGAPEAAASEPGTVSGSSGNVLLSGFELQGEGYDDIYAFRGHAGIAASWVQSDSLRFELAGIASQLDQWLVAGEAMVNVPDWPASALVFEANGSGANISGRLDAPDLFGGSLLASASSTADEGQPWNGQLEVSNLSISPLLDALSPHLGSDLSDQLSTTIDLLRAEKLTTTIEASGALEPFSIVANVKNLATGVQGRPMTAQGRFEYDENSFTTPGFSVRSGASDLQLQGQLDGLAGIVLDVNIANLDDFFRGSAGRLSGQINYRQDPGGGFAQSWLRTELAGENLRFEDWQIGQVKIGALDPAAAAEKHAVFETAQSRPPLALQIEASHISGPAGEYPVLSALVLGQINALAVALTTRTQDTGLSVEFTAESMGDNSDAWQGTLHALTIEPPQGMPWVLGDPARFRYHDGLSIAAACLAANDTASMCVDIEQSPDGSELGRINVASLSPDVFSTVTDWPLTFTQQMSGTLGWTRTADSSLSAQADLKITPGVVNDQSEGTELFQSGEGTLHFLIEDGSLVSGILNIPLDSGKIDIDFALPDLLEEGETELNGRIRVNLDNLEALTAFIPNLAQVSGRFSVDLLVEGTPENPRFTGSTSLRQGRLSLPAAGLRLNDIEIDGQLDNANQIRMDGSFTAGTGPGELEAILDLSDTLTPKLRAHLTGKGMTLINVPDMQLLADTDVRFDWVGNELNLLGTVHVPTARFAPRYLPSDTASESPDVVIVSNGEPVNAAPDTSSDWKINGDLAVSLGDNVTIELELAKASATGAAMFSWRGDEMPIANGEYNIRGDIQAYGQTLEITRAAIRFPNVKADSPYLDIRAERAIYGNSLVTKAGVLVNGTIKRPQTEPYTVPATNADRARALLITGSDFDYEQGVGAVNVGTYIAPKLYLSYGVGLFEEGNVITARYELKRNFGVKATSGQDETGIDFSYTIER